MERSIEFNNAGVQCIEAGYHKMAWDLFKGALEVRLAIERSELQSKGSGSQPDSRHRNSYIEKAGFHLLNLESYLGVGGAITDQNDSQSEMVSASTQPNLGSGQRHGPTGQGDSDIPPESLDAPFLFSHPMKLESDSNMSTRRQSATIIFNLALVDHRKNRCSEQAVALYELGMTLLTGDTVDMLGIALMNNIGVWCYENGDMDGAVACMGHLASFLGSCSSSINQVQKDGLQSNILWLTNPPFAASPAA